MFFDAFPDYLQGPYLLIFYPIVLTISGTVFLVGSCWGCWYCDRLEATQKQKLLLENLRKNVDEKVDDATIMKEINLFNKQQSNGGNQAGGYAFYCSVRNKIRDPFFLIAFLVLLAVVVMASALTGCYYLVNVNFVKDE